MSLKLLIFDLDGTLLDTKKDLTDSMNRTLSKYSLGPLSEEDVWSYIGDGSAYFVERCFKHFESDKPKGAVEYFLDDYAKHCLDSTRPYHGMTRLLERLTSFRKCIVTNKTDSITQRLCEGLGLKKYFDLVVGEGKYRKKPDPEAILYVMKRLNPENSGTVIIGDSTIDIISGKNAKIGTCGVTWGVHTRERLASAAPDHIVSDPSELEDILLHWS